MGNRLGRTAFALLKPDAVLRQIEGETLDILEELGFRIIDFRIGRFTGDAFNRAYAPGFRWDLDFWHHNQKAYDYGPVVGLLLSTKQTSFGNCENAQTFLSSQKGNALPRYQESHTIRARCRATNRVFNVVHIPDTLEAGAMEASIWFGKSLPEVLKAKSNDAKFENRRNDLQAEILRHGYFEHRRCDGELVYYLIKLRLLHSIEKQSNFPSQAEHVFAPLRRLYGSTISVLSDVSDLGLRDRTLRSSLAVEAQILRDLNCRDIFNYHPEHTLKQTITVIPALNEMANLSQVLDFFWHLLGQWRVFVSDLETYLVNTTFRYKS